jgi:hypothetical protein
MCAWRWNFSDRCIDLLNDWRAARMLLGLLVIGDVRVGGASCREFRLGLILGLRDGSCA